MQPIQNQRVVVYSYDHNGMKLAHVGLFNMKFVNGKNNSGWRLAIQIGKANYATSGYVSYNLKSNSYTESKEHVFESGFHLMLMNTDSTLWQVNVVAEDVAIDEALAIRAHKITELSAQGFVTTEPKNKTCSMSGETGNRNWGKPVQAKNYTKDKLEKLCIKLTTGMNFKSHADFRSISRLVYKELTRDSGPGELTKGQIWSMFNSVAN